MASLSRLVVGLGNPGPEYERTRHNVGFRVVDALAHRLRVSFERTHGSLVASGQYKNRAIGLAKPLSFMNRSGEAVAPLCEHYNIAPNDLIVVVDDLHLSVGTLRLRPSGSSGGHNGLENVAKHLGTTAFPRLRIGIGNDFDEGEQVDYVLSPFSTQQEETVQEVIEEAVEALLTVVREDLDTAMNRFN